MDVDLDAADSGINVKMELEMDVHQLMRVQTQTLSLSSFWMEILLSDLLIRGLACDSIFSGADSSLSLSLSLSLLWLEGCRGSFSAAFSIWSFPEGWNSSQGLVCLHREAGSSAGLN